MTAPLSQTEAAALRRMFSATVFRQLGQHAASPLFARLIRQTRLSARQDTVGWVFDDALKLLSYSNQRDDYTYRCVFMQARYNPSTQTVLSEVRTGKRKADLVVLGQNGVAYEIKSDRDSLARLKQQIEAYRGVFASVTVLAGSKHINHVARLVPHDVGIIELTEHNTLRDVRLPEDQPWRVDPVRVLDIMRRGEACQVLENLGLEVPQVPNTLIRTELARIFSTLEPAAVHEQMVHTLRMSRSQQRLVPFIETLPASLRPRALAVYPRGHEQDGAIRALATPLPAALAWG